MVNNQDKFFNIVDMLVRLNEDQQLEMEEYRNGLHPMQWALDMATVSLSAGRRIGKTSYIKQRARCADLVVIHNDMMKKEYQGSRAVVRTASEMNRNGMDAYRGRRESVGYNKVYVDEPSLVFNTLDKMNFYSLFVGNHCPYACANMFIMLGSIV